MSLKDIYISGFVHSLGVITAFTLVYPLFCYATRKENHIDIYHQKCMNCDISSETDDETDDENDDENENDERSNNEVNTNNDVLPIIHY